MLLACATGAMGGFAVELVLAGLGALAALVVLVALIGVAVQGGAQVLLAALGLLLDAREQPERDAGQRPAAPRSDRELFARLERARQAALPSHHAR